MGYCTIEDMRALLPKNVTIGNDTVTTPTIQPNLPGTGGASVISTNIAQDYIKKAGEEIDSALRTIYVCPLQRIKIYETELIQNANAAATSIMVYDNQQFDINTLVRISDNSGSELHYVSTMPARAATNIHTLTLQEPMGRQFTVGSRVSILEYPDPIPLMCARLAISIGFDRTFVAEQQPDVSSYGKTQRNLANQDLDRILTGVVRLQGQNHMGRRFARTSVMDTWKTAPEYQAGSNRES